MMSRLMYGEPNMVLGIWDTMTKSILLMLSFYDNKKEVEEGKIVYGKVNDQTAMIFRFDFDPDEMAKRLEDLEVMEKVNAVVEKREMFSISPIQRP